MHIRTVVIVMVGALATATAAPPAETSAPATPMAGPFPSLTAFCQSVAARSCPKESSQGDPQTFTCKPKPDALGPEHGGFDEARLFSTTCHLAYDPPGTNARDHDYDDAYLALHRADGWWVSRPLAKADSGFHSSEALQLGTPTWRDVPAGWVATVGIDGEWAGGNAQDFQRQWLVFAGAGPSGKPSCTSPILIREKVTMAMDDEEDEKKNKSWRLTPTWLDDGALELRRKRGKGRVYRIVLP